MPIRAEALPVAVDRLRESGEVVVLARPERRCVGALQIGDESLGELLLWLARELPDRVDAHHVLEPEAPVWPLRNRRERRVLGERRVLVLCEADDRDRVQGEREAS